MAPTVQLLQSRQPDQVLSEVDTAQSDPSAQKTSFQSAEAALEEQAAEAKTAQELQKAKLSGSHAQSFHRMAKNEKVIEVHAIARRWRQEQA